ncbi:1607_t:CDS:2 [Entrophospora sp. SA101]|nr:1607_t:CDS:2 [Entrophospora sp. SA101]
MINDCANEDFTNYIFTLALTKLKLQILRNKNESTKHKAAEQKHKNNPQPLQSSLLSFTNNDHDKINIAIIEAFTKADIPLDKIDKLKVIF